MGGEGVVATIAFKDPAKTSHCANPNFSPSVPPFRKLSHLLPPRMAPGATAPESSTTFHGASVRDYQGRSWLTPPAGTRPVDPSELSSYRCYVPTRCGGTIKNAHQKGVHCVRFFPDYGHLLLSAGLDGEVKCWDVARRKVMRVYKGHTAAVRDIAWSNDGSRFLSVR